jgi:hypothetical protein
MTLCCADDAWQSAADGQVEVPAMFEERGLAHAAQAPGSRRRQCSSSLRVFEQQSWTAADMWAAAAGPCALRLCQLQVGIVRAAATQLLLWRLRLLLQLSAWRHDCSRCPQWAHGPS